MSTKHWWDVQLLVQGGTARIRLHSHKHDHLYDLPIGEAEHIARELGEAARLYRELGFKAPRQRRRPKTPPDAGE